jgi:hypothetical protein
LILSSSPTPGLRARLAASAALILSSTLSSALSANLILPG